MVTLSHFILIAAICLFGIVFAGCALDGTSPNVKVPDIYWPPPPETERIKFVRFITRPEDIGAETSTFDVVWNYVFGSSFMGLISPYCLETDNMGHLYVVDSSLKNVHVFDLSAGKYHTFDTVDSPFLTPIDIALDNETGLIYVSDSEGKSIKIYDELGKKYISSFGKGDLQRPTGIAVNHVTSELLVVDTVAGSILRYDLKNNTLKGKFGSRGTEDGQLNFPTHIYVDIEGNILVADSMNFKIQTFSSSGEFTSSFGKAGDSQGFLSRPRGIAKDSDGNIYVVDALQDSIQIFNDKGELLIKIGGQGSGYGQFWLPAGITVDNDDKIYVADSFNKRVQIFQYLPVKDDSGLTGEDKK